MHHLRMGYSDSLWTRSHSVAEPRLGLGLVMAASLATP